MTNNSNTCDNLLTPPGHAMNNEEQQQHTQNPPLPSPTTIHLMREELQSQIKEYGRRIKEYEDNRRAKRKQTVQSRRKVVSNSHRRLLDEMLMIQEQCDAKGYIYGMVTKTGKPVTGASDSLREWWKSQVMFDKTGPIQIEKYYKEHSLYINPDQENEAKSTTELLMEISDPILGSILSLLMQHCDPPQRKFRFEGGQQPTWWPTGHESWWGQIGISAEGPPPFRKPHNLKKKWKVAVIVGILKVKSPKFSHLYAHVKQSRSLTQRMNAKELKFWTSALVSEAKRYCHEHPNSADVALEFLHAYGSS